MDDDRVKERDQTGRIVGFLRVKLTYGTQQETFKISLSAQTRTIIPLHLLFVDEVLRRIFDRNDTKVARERYML
jgi:hypothetical protein